MLYRITIVGDRDRQRAARILAGFGSEDAYAPGTWQCHMTPVQVDALRRIVRVFAFPVPEMADWGRINFQREETDE